MAIRTVALIGLGAIGSFLAPRLEQAVGAGNFRIVAGGERAERIRRAGTTVNGQVYRFPIADPAQRDPADLVILSVKYQQLPQAVRDMGGQVGEHTTIVSFLNGIDSEEIIAGTYGWGPVVYGLARVSVMLKDRVTRYDPAAGYFLFGEAKNPPEQPHTARIADMDALFAKAGIRHSVPEDMILEIWKKFMCNVSENQSSAILGIPFGAWHVSEHANHIREMAMWEVVRIANAAGIGLNAQDVADQHKNLLAIAYGNKTSMLQDLESGRPTEVEMLAGTVLALGRRYGIPTPVNEVFYHSIKVLEEKNAGII